MYRTGDERETIRFNGNGQKYGYYIAKAPANHRNDMHCAKDEAGEVVEQLDQDVGGFIRADWEAVNLGPTPAEIYVDIVSLFSLAKTTL